MIVIWHGAKLIDELEAQGWTIYRISEHLGRKWDTVNRWRLVEPRYSDAQAIIELHAKICIKTTISSAVCSTGNHP